MSELKINMPLTLRIVTPEGGFPEILCDSIILTVKDSKKDSPGGLYGIRKGHAPSLIATDKGKVSAFARGEKIFEASLSDGFATVEKNTVTVTANKM